MQPHSLPFPVLSPPLHAELAFTIGTTLILAGFLLWWVLGGEYRRRGFMLPLVFAGAALSALVIEPVFDNVLLYWYYPGSRFVVLRAFDRTIPLFVPLGYAWFFGGIAYYLSRVLAVGAAPVRIWSLFAATVAIDWLAVSTCQWMQLSVFYGPQTFWFFGSPLWFSFCDATGAFVLGATLSVVTRGTAPHPVAILLMPTLAYGGGLGAVTAPVSLALNSDAPVPIIWLGGAATIGLCLMLIHAIVRSAGRASVAAQVPPTRTRN